MCRIRFGDLLYNRRILHLYSSHILCLVTSLVVMSASVDNEMGLHGQNVIWHIQNIDPWASGVQAFLPLLFLAAVTLSLVYKFAMCEEYRVWLWDHCRLCMGLLRVSVHRKRDSEIFGKNTLCFPGWLLCCSNCQQARFYLGNCLLNFLFWVIHLE